MASRPSVIPDAFNGDGSWEQWSYHFTNVAEVNEWDNEAKLKWLKVRLTGKAQTAFQRLSEEVRGSYSESIKALKERFEPSSRQTRYQAELQSRRRKKDESWADLADNLRLLADKAYPEMQDKARERLALNAYLALLENPHVAFGVKQKAPQTLDAAISATLELESYLSPKMTVASVEATTQEEEQSHSSVSTVSQVSNDKLAVMFERLVDRFDKLEAVCLQKKVPDRRDEGRDGSGARLDSRGYSRNQRGSFPRRQSDLVCWNCGKTGHIARQCRSLRQQQGN